LILCVANKGIFPAIVSTPVAEAFLFVLKQPRNGISAAFMGELVTVHPRRVVLESKIGEMSDCIVSANNCQGSADKRITLWIGEQAVFPLQSVAFDSCFEPLYGVS